MGRPVQLWLPQLCERRQRWRDVRRGYREAGCAIPVAAVGISARLDAAHRSGTGVGGRGAEGPRRGGDGSAAAGPRAARGRPWPRRPSEAARHRAACRHSADRRPTAGEQQAAVLQRSDRLQHTAQEERVRRAAFRSRLAGGRGRGDRQERQRGPGGWRALWRPRGRRAQAAQQGGKAKRSIGSGKAEDRARGLVHLPWPVLHVAPPQQRPVDGPLGRRRRGGRGVPLHTWLGRRAAGRELHGGKAAISRPAVGPRGAERDPSKESPCKAQLPEAARVALRQRELLGATPAACGGPRQAARERLPADGGLCQVPHHVDERRAERARAAGVRAADPAAVGGGADAAVAPGAGEQLERRVHEPRRGARRWPESPRRRRRRGRLGGTRLARPRLRLAAGSRLPGQRRWHALLAALAAISGSAAAWRRRAQRVRRLVPVPAARRVPP
mmetsp:Transcript_33673/g.96695  ORF Transcript_33673/g.96695 Transcript_33673/m.96695 type:complete len:443 (+) Transcript_33673:646-1974(+)